MNFLIEIKNGKIIEGAVLLHSPVKYMSSALKSGIYTLIFSILAALAIASIRKPANIVKKIFIISLLV